MAETITSPPLHQNSDLVTPEFLHGLLIGSVRRLDEMVLNHERLATFARRTMPGVPSYEEITDEANSFAELFAAVVTQQEIKVFADLSHRDGPTKAELCVLTVAPKSAVLRGLFGVYGSGIRYSTPLTPPLCESLVFQAQIPEPRGF